MKNWKKIVILTFLTICALGCTCTVQSDWPGGWGTKDHEQHTTEYRRP